jgi:putative Holliday junction resolvase
MDSQPGIPVSGPIAAVDYGEKRIGLAISDAGQSLAGAAETAPGAGRPESDASLILGWAVQRDAVGIVVGLPLNMDDTDSAQTKLSRQLAEALRSLSGARPVELHDERLSSFAADEMMEHAAVPRARRRGLRDAFAARAILQSFLDARHPPTG